MERSEFVSMPLAQTSRLRTVARLPFSVEEDIGLNVQRLHQTMQVGGIRFLRIDSRSDEETSGVDVQIVGMNSRGGAYAGGAKEKMVPTCSSNQGNQNHEPMDKGSRWIDVDVHINAAEIKQRILHSGEDVRESESWAGHIDSGLKQALNQRGREHLTGKIDSFNRFMMAIIYGGDFLRACDASFSDLVVGNFNPHLPKVNDFAFSVLFSGLFWTTWSSIEHGFEKPGQGRRISLFYGCELDRALLLTGLTRFSTLAKSLDEK